MEFNKLPAFVLLLVMVGMILGVGMLVLDKFGVATKTSTTVTNESVNFTNGAGNVDYGGVTAIDALINSTSPYTAVAASNFSFTEAGAITITDGLNSNISALITYKYGKNSTTSTALTATTDAIAPIATTWLGLIVTIAVLALILFLVIRSFVLNKR